MTRSYRCSSYPHLAPWLILGTALLLTGCGRVPLVPVL